MPLRCACTIFGRAFAPSTGVHAWDAENRLIKVEDATGSLIPFEYDGCEARTKRHAGGDTMACYNKYWEVDLTTGVVTRSTTFGGARAAQQKGTTLTYVHRDHLAGTISTDKKFTG